MRKINYAFIIIGLIICVMASGCFPNVETESKPTLTNQSQTSTIDYPTHIYDDDIESLNIDADVVLPLNFDSQQTLSLSSAEYKVWDRENIVSKLSNGRQIIDQSYGENTGPDDLFYSYTFDDSASLTFTTEGIFYTTQMDKEYQYAYYFDNYENYIYDNTLSEIFIENEIIGIEKNDALNSAGDIISLLNIKEVLAEPTIYTLDATTMNNLQNESDTVDKYGNPLEEWHDEQEAYLLVYPALYQNIPSLKMNAISENERISSSSVYFVYGRNGMISFCVSGILDINNTEQESNTFSPVNAVENIKSFFNSIIMDAELNILVIKLGYIIKSDFENNKDVNVEPVWFIYGEYENAISENTDSKSVQNKDNYISLISAVTGKTIPIVSIGR